MAIKPILLSLLRNKFINSVLVVQIAMTMAVLSASTLVAVKTLEDWGMPSGMPHDRIIRIGAKMFDPTQSVEAAMHRDLERLNELDTVAAFTRSNFTPVEAEEEINVYRSSSQEAEPEDTVVFAVDHHFLATFELELLDGRAFTAADEMVVEASQPERAPVVMISQAMADALFPEESPLGKTLWLKKGADPVNVIGVYSNFMVGAGMNGLGKSYQSILRPNIVWNKTYGPQYFIRVESTPAEAMIDILVTLFYQEPGRYVYASELLKRAKKRMYDGRGSRAVTSLSISLMLVLIAAIGIGGLTSFQINQRRHVIGTRRALGARKSDIYRYVFTENSIISITGLFIGLLIALYLVFQQSSLQETNFLNVGWLLVIALFIWIINLLATWYPAYQAASIAPAIVTKGS